MDANNRIDSMMEVFTDDQIRKLIKEYNHLKDTGILPNDSVYRLLSEGICEIYGVNFDLRMGETWLQNEVFKRFLNQA